MYSKCRILILTHQRESGKVHFFFSYGIYKLMLSKEKRSKFCNLWPSNILVRRCYSKVGSSLSLHVYNLVSFASVLVTFCVNPCPWESNLGPLLKSSLPCSPFLSPTSGEAREILSFIIKIQLNRRENPI